MKSIVVIDDKDHALKQVIFESPGVNKYKIAFRHFETIKAFREEKMQNIFLVFLDFFLSKDKDYGSSLIPDLQCEHLVCFSSMKQASDHMYNEALKVGRNKIENVYSVQKLKATIENEELNAVLRRIFS